MRKYFITSDVHSYYTLLAEALHMKGFNINNPEHILVVCGDLFDRGDESKELLGFVKSLGDRFIYIKGNHEFLLSDCVYEILTGYSIGNHHYSNKTINTISQLTDIPIEEFYYTRLSDSVKQAVKEKMLPILDWINNKTVNYKEIGDYILVHGWIPTLCSDLNILKGTSSSKPTDKNFWDSNPSSWETAVWLNGMKMWKQGSKIPDKTIICGHYHSSWGHSHLHMDRKEFPQKNQKDWQKSFEPFIDDGIMAIDGCTAYSGIVNVIVLEI